MTNNKTNYTVEEVRKLSRLWCGEPSVHGENKKALCLLAEKRS